MKKKKKIILMMIFATAVCILGDTRQIRAAGVSNSIEEKNTFLPLVDNRESKIGRYQFNYTGNYNYFSNFNHITKTEEGAVRKNVLKDYGSYTNSSGGKLVQPEKETKVVKAYLIWETRKPYKKSDKVTLVASDKKTKKSYYADYAYNDNRKWEGWKDTNNNVIDMRRLYCMAADVTSFVQKHGYGNYYVANIPEYHTIDAGGDNVCSWQLIVVEEGEELPVRYMSLRLGAKWKFGDKNYDNSSDYDTLKMTVNFAQGVKTGGNGGGQLLIGFANDHDAKDTNGNPKVPTGSIYTGSDTSQRKKMKFAHTPYAGGLYKQNSYEAKEYGLIVGMNSYKSGLKSGQSSMTAKIEDVYWNTSIFIGVAVDVDVPEFSSAQKTAVSSSSAATVTGTITNKMESGEKTGVYSGQATITLDDALMVNDTSAVSATLNGKALAASKITLKDSHTIVIKADLDNGTEELSYMISCVTDAAANGKANSGNGITKFRNNHSYSGVLRSNGVKTGMQIDNMCNKKSSADPKYVVTVKKASNTASQTGITKFTYTTKDVTYNKDTTVKATLASGYEFEKWVRKENHTNASSNIKNHPYSFTMPAHNITLIAYAKLSKSTLKIDPNGGTWNGNQTVQSFLENAGTTKDIPIPVREGYTFKGWTKSNPFYGSLTYKGSGTTGAAIYTFGSAGGITDTLTANWQINIYKVILHEGTGIENVTGAGTYNYGASVNISAKVKSGFSWEKWTGSYQTTKINYTFKMPAKDVELTAHASMNEYIIHFDPNGGSEVTQIPDIKVKYNEEVTLPSVTLPDGRDAYLKYTLDGVNISDQVVSGQIVLNAVGVVVRECEDAIPEGSIVALDGTITTPEGAIIMPDGTATAPDGTVTAPDGTVLMPDGTATAPDGTVTAPDGTIITPTINDTPEVTDENIGEAENKTAEQTNAEALSDRELQPDKKAYKSVYKGWAFADGKESFEPQFAANDTIKVSSIIDAAGTVKNGATIILYAIWDDCPWITATNLYYTLEQAQSGVVTVDEILSHAYAADREDGSPIAPGVHENGTSFTIPDYRETDFTSFQHEGSVTENLTVVDSAGSTYVKQITVYVVDTTPVMGEPEGATRFINEYYYNQSYEYGGLEEDSLWKTDPEYAAVLQKAFENLNNNTPIQTYSFTHEEILQMKEYIASHGVGDRIEEGALQKFYEMFMASNMQKKMT